MRARAFTRPWRLTAAILVAAVVAALSSVPAQAQEREPDPLSTTFASLPEAAAAGAIDPELVKPLLGGKPVTLFAVLDARALVRAYGDGNPTAVRAATASLAALRTKVLGTVEGRVEVLRTYDVVPAVLLRISRADVALELINLVAVLSLTRDRLNDHMLTVSLPLIRQPQIAAMGLTGAGTSVAVLDTGADFTNAAFGSCTAPGVPAGCRVPVAVEIAPDDGSRDDNGHGTNVAGIVAGVAPGASIIPIDVFAGARASDHDILAGLNWVLLNQYSRNIRAVNLSLGITGSYYNSPCDGGLFDRNPYVTPFYLLRQGGSLPVVAAGNSAQDRGVFDDGLAAPACTVGAVRVGAVYTANVGAMAWTSCTDSTTAADQITCFSQDSALLTVLAPGASITAAGLTFGGTSQAAPHVAGAVAVLAQGRPAATAADLESYLTTSPTTLTDSRTARSHPRLDLAAAVGAAVPAPANDNRAAATTLTTWSGVLDQTTWLATQEPGEPAHAGNSGGASVWYRWTAVQSGTAVIATSGSDYDTLLAAYRDNAGTLVQLAANDDAGPTDIRSLITFPVNAGDTVLVAVDGKNTGGRPTGGHLHLNWNLPNDNIANAAPILPGTTAGANIGASHEPGEPHHCSDGFNSASVWYRYLGGSGPLRVQAHGTRSLCVAVYTSTVATPAVNQVTAVTSASDDGPDPIDFTVNLTAGATYWIAVDGVSVESNCSPVTGQCWYITPTGTFTLSLT
jgi:subtilisin family serine protease